MAIIEYRSIELDYCVKCMGVWFDQSEIDLLLKTAATFTDGMIPVFKKLTTQINEDVRPCPLCKKTMHKVSLGGSKTVLDQCPDGEGIWFDAGELAASIAAVAGANQEPVLTLLREFLGAAINVPEK